MDSKDQLKRQAATILLNLGNEQEFSVPKKVVTQCNRSVNLAIFKNVYVIVMHHLKAKQC